MKIKIILMFIIMFFGLLINYANAACTEEEISSLKRDIKNIKVKYRHLGAVQDDDFMTVYNRFNVTFNNLNDDFYIEMFNFEYVKYQESGVIEDTFTTGSWDVYIYSKKCGKEIGSINVTLPRFNVYSLDPLCEGISGDDFALCGKYYDYDIPYISFKERVQNYINTHNIVKNDETEINNKEKNFIYYINYLTHFIKENYNYFIFLFIVIIAIVVLLFMRVKTRKRGVLK